ncbi:MAG: hypothetical protein IJ644_08195 [Oscillospiraceae bacterium]|nr:hypothetical protein [Oscillospiraceae bacterium]
MSVLKRMTAGLTALSLVAVCTGCKNTTTAMTIGDYVVPAGVYLYYLNSAYNSALSQLAEENPDLDTTDVKAVKATPLEGKDVRTWCEDKAIEFCTDFVATEKKFDELGLELDAETKTNLDSMMEYYWASYEETMTENGISQESFRKIMTSSYKSEQIFDYYYAVGGEEGVTDEELRQYYIDNNIRAQYLSFDLHDSDGNLLKSEDKAEIKALAEGYQKRVEDAYKAGGADAVMTEMDAVKEDYEAYQESVAAAEAEAAAAETETESSAEAEVVVDETAEALNAPRILTAEEVSSPEETSETDTESETAEDTTEPETDAETSAETSADAETSAEEETAVASDEDADSETETSSEDASSEETADSETDETSDSESDSDDEVTDDEAVLAEEETSAPYQNENIISVINKDDYDNEEDIYYTPDETVYNKLISITEADYGKIYFIEEDEVYYLVVRYDITQRMTEDDLWTESAVTNAEYGKYYDAFEAKMDEWASALTVARNEASFKRYDPYEYHF